MRHLLKTAILCISLVPFSAVSVSAAVLVNYDPTGYQKPSVSDLAPALVNPAVAATSLSNHGPFYQWQNYNVRPVRVGAGPLDTVGGFYIEFSISAQNPGNAVQLSTIQYDFRSYCTGETFTISLMTSADNFASVVDAFNVTQVTTNGVYAGSHTFDASTVPSTQGNLIIRFYLHDLLNSCPENTDADGVAGWADIRSTADTTGPGTGITVNGEVVQPPVATEPTTWGRVKALYAGQ